MIRVVDKKQHVFCGRKGNSANVIPVEFMKRLRASYSVEDAESVIPGIGEVEVAEKVGGHESHGSHAGAQQVR